MSAVIEILETIVNRVEFVEKIDKLDGVIIPDAPKELTDKYRWLQCSLKNETQFSILLLETYFDSGRYWDAPGSLGSFDQLVFSCCNDDGVPTGVMGGTAFRLSLDDTHYYDFALGWTNPLLGSYKAGAVESSNPKDGYDAADDRAGYLQSKYIFEGKDKDGKPANFQIHISSSPSQKPEFVVTQV